jgi:hypothetical protein
MNKMPSDASDDFEDELLPEYDFDYSKAKPNRFATGAGLPTEGDRATDLQVVIDADLARVFSTPEAVNHALRSLISAMPEGKSS